VQPDLNSSSLLEWLRSYVDHHPDLLDFGITVPTLAPSEARLRRFISQGHAGDMEYMRQNIEQRLDTRTFAPWSRSLVFFALKPASPLRRDARNPATPLKASSEKRYAIAAYAQGPDYHFRAKAILRELEEGFQSFAHTHSIPLHFRGFVDTAPVFERDFAAEAGLGWRGKNCTLLHRKHGSHFLLFGCALNWELTPSQPVESFCGGCTLCLDACPTDAFVAPGELDATKCISYWTIEQRKNFPEPLANRFDDWIYGCDRCQTVCPWNRKHLQPLPPTGSDDFHQDAETWLTWLAPGGGFQSRFKHSPLLRAGRKGMLRNLANAIARQGDVRVLSRLKGILAQETDAMVKGSLESAIQKLESVHHSSDGPSPEEESGA
jgi:epoxyqueuosine reductase